MIELLDEKLLVLGSTVFGAFLAFLSSYLVGRLRYRSDNLKTSLDTIVGGNKVLIESLFAQIEALKKEVAELKLELQVYQQENSAMLRRIRDLEQERLELLLQISGRIERING